MHFLPPIPPHSCRPDVEAYWYGMLLIGGLLLLLTMIFILIFPFNVRYVHNAKSKTKTTFPRYTDYITLMVVTLFFYAAWGFGLPALRPLNLGILRIIFECIFIVCSGLLGVAMVCGYVFFSEKVRNACCRHSPDPNTRQVYGFNAANENVYMTNVGDDEIPFSEMDANKPPPDYDTLDGGSMVGDGARYEEGFDDEEMDEDLDMTKEDIEKVFTNFSGGADVDTLF